MARPTPTSAAAMAITNRAKTCPADVVVRRAPKAIRLMLTALRIELDRHQHEHAVAAGQDAVDADGEQHGAEQQELVEQQGLYVLPGQDDGADEGGERARRPTASNGTRYVAEDRVADLRRWSARELGREISSSPYSSMQGVGQEAGEQQGDDHGRRTSLAGC